VLCKHQVHQMNPYMHHIMIIKLIVIADSTEPQVLFTKCIGHLCNVTVTSRKMRNFDVMDSFNNCQLNFHENLYGYSFDVT